jgi:hypothetical protein
MKTSSTATARPTVVSHPGGRASVIQSIRHQVYL